MLFRAVTQTFLPENGALYGDLYGRQITIQIAIQSAIFEEKRSGNGSSIYTTCRPRPSDSIDQSSSVSYPYLLFNRMVGLVTSVFMLNVEHRFNRLDYAPMCDISATISCTVPTAHPFGHIVLGIPNLTIGVVFYTGCIIASGIYCVHQW